MVAGLLVPWFDAPTEAALLPAPIAMRAGESWADNLVQGGAARAFAQRADRERLFTRAQLTAMARELRRMRHHHHHEAPRLPGF